MCFEERLSVFRNTAGLVYRPNLRQWTDPKERTGVSMKEDQATCIYFYTASRVILAEGRTGASSCVIYIFKCHCSYRLSLIRSKLHVKCEFKLDIY